MRNNPDSHRMIRLAGLVGLPLGGVVLGIGGMCLWLHAQPTESGESIPAPAAQLEPDGRAPDAAARIEALYATPAQSLYLDNFKAPSMARDTWEQAQKVIYARVPSARTVDGEKPLLALLANAINPVQEAHAETQAAGNAPKASGTADAAQKKPGTTGAAPGKTVAATPAPKPAPGKGETTAATEDPAEENAFPSTFSAGSLGQLTQLRAELEQLKLQVTIEEARTRLNQLRGTASPAPQPMPTLEYPPIAMPATPARDKSLRILSIQSVNGKFTATVGTASGPRVVSQNDTINGNRVVSISRNSVVINRGQGNETLSIQD